MKQNWVYKKLGDVCDFQGGSQPPKGEWSKEQKLGYVRMLQIRDFTQSSTDYVEYVKMSKSLKYCMSDDILIGRYGASVGKILTGLEGAYNVAIIKSIPDESLLSKPFIKKYFLSSFFQQKLLLMSQQRAAQAGFSKEDVSDFLIPVPPMSEQSRIVAELDLLTGIIDKQKAQLKELDNLAQSIFYDMFGDPIENPKGWDVKKLGDVCSSVSYGTSSPSSPNGKYKYLRMNNITYDGFLDLTDLKYIDVDDDEFEKYSVREGDILFNRTNSMDLIGKTTYIHGMEPMIIAGYIIRVRVIDSIMPVFVSKFMNTPAMKKKLKGMAKGAVNQANINSKELKSIDIVLPPLKLQQEFADKITAIESQKSAINQSMAETQKLLDYTMDKYFG